MPFRLHLLPLPVALVMLAGCNTPPDAPTVTIGPLGPRTGDDLVTVVEGASDNQGDRLTFTYAWKQDGLPRPELETDTVPSSETTKGEVWEVTVTPNDGELDGEAGSASTAILNTAPEVTVAISPEAPTTDDDVTAVATGTDADDDAVTFSYGWTLDGGPDATVADTITSDRTEHGQRWAATVTPHDGEAAGEAVTADVEVANSAPVMLSVTLVPESPYVTEDVVAVVESSDADGDNVTYTYTWYVDGTAAQSGESDTLAAGSFAKHQLINVEVMPNDGAVDGEAFASTDAEVLNSLPSGTGASITPAEAYEASTLTCEPAGFSVYCLSRNRTLHRAA
jgi:hypothetical protein